MVSGEAQLYTMEGIAAGLIMILTAYLVLGATSVYTPGDTHLTDMQLEQVGSDILKIMDTPGNFNATENPLGTSELERIVATNDAARFDQIFREKYLWLEQYKIAAQTTTMSGSSIFINASIYYHSLDPANPVKSYLFSSRTFPASGSESGVKVTRFVKVPGKNTTPFCNAEIPPICTHMPDDGTVRDGPQVVLVEVFLWKN